jgi:hypothetical protein
VDPKDPRRWLVLLIPLAVVLLAAILAALASAH